MKMKKLITVPLCLALAAGTLAGCGNGNSGSGDSGTADKGGGGSEAVSENKEDGKEVSD